MEEMITHSDLFTTTINRTPCTGGSFRENDHAVLPSQGRAEDGNHHVLRKQLRHMGAPVDPGIHHIRPLLQHVAPLLGVLGFVVDRTRRTAVLVGEALLDPVAIEADLVEQRRTCATQVVYRERLQRQTGGLGALGHDLGHAVERRLGHAAVGVVTRRRETFFNTSRGQIPLPWLGSNDALPLATRMETRLPWRPTRGSLTSPSYLVRNRTLGPPLDNNPEIPPSSRDEGLRLLHGLETNLATSLQTPQEA